ncbi:helix-turn-helix transcriptional regulator [Candidatus Poribacteria bacterium]|nr:helix-turn-helix transcriptional regulator [Candidatus Poribacteria bacterium]
MFRTPILLIGQEISFPTAAPLQFQAALEQFFNDLLDPLVGEMWFIVRKEQGCLSLRLICDQTHKRSESRIQRALDFIHTHYYEHHLSLKQIARKACLSDSHFCRHFRREVGMSCVQYLNHFRITRAKPLLSESKQTITAIASAIGFDNLTHFERVFKQIVGQTPSEYRNATHPKKVESVGRKSNRC